MHCICSVFTVLQDTELSVTEFTTEASFDNMYFGVPNCVLQTGSDVTPVTTSTLCTANSLCYERLNNDLLSEVSPPLPTSLLTFVSSFVLSFLLSLTLVSGKKIVEGCVCLTMCPIRLRCRSGSNSARRSRLQRWAR